MSLFGRGGRVLTAAWAPDQGVILGSSELPETWLRALNRVGHDLQVRQYGGPVDRIDWVGEYDPDSGMVVVLSSVTVAGREPSGLGASGNAARVDETEDQVAVSIADFVQSEVADNGVAWPWRDVGGFMDPVIMGAMAVWTDEGRRHRRIGDL